MGPLKFPCSEKATNFYEIPNFDLSYVFSNLLTGIEAELISLGVQF